LNLDNLMVSIEWNRWVWGVESQSLGLGGELSSQHSAARQVPVATGWACRIIA